MAIIGFLFGICVAMLIGLALMTGTSYEGVSVAINIFVEPLLCVLIMIPALLAILKKDHEAKIAFRVFKYMIWVLVAIGGVSLAYSGCWFLGRMDQLQGFSFAQMFSYSPGQWAAFVRQVESLFPESIHSENSIFVYIRDNLIYLSGQLRVTYQALNIIIYVIAELLSLGLFYMAYRIKRSRIVYFLAAVVCFIVSIVPTLYLIVDSL